MGRGWWRFHLTDKVNGIFVLGSEPSSQGFLWEIFEIIIDQWR